MPIDPEFLELLACPHCKAPLTASAWKDSTAEEGLRCTACSRVYPVRGGIPELLEGEAWEP